MILTSEIVYFSDFMEEFGKFDYFSVPTYTTYFIPQQVDDYFDLFDNVKSSV